MAKETSNVTGLSDKEIFALADRLRGSDEPLNLAVSHFGYEVDEEKLEDDLRVVGQVGICGTCGYWWDTMELDADGACPDCAPE